MATYSPFIIFIVSAFSLVSFCSSLPFILLHGLGDSCSNPGPVLYTQQLRYLSGSLGFCLEVGNGAITSWDTPLEAQVEEVCRKVKAIPELQNGYNIVGQSQGNLVGRGLVELCDDAPPVINFISLGGPHAGVAFIPNCSQFDALCSHYAALLGRGVYTNYVQAHVAPSGYTKLPYDYLVYLAKCSFLPKLNNELLQKNATYKQRITNLKNLVLIMFQEDGVVKPKESSLFGYYADGIPGPVLPLQQTRLYTEDWIGLRTLDETGRLKLISVPGVHLLISLSDTMRYVVPYLKDGA
ncbi:palmitoyl-protein thioesterase 1-like [Coffea eugenioides]|uniref:palmitoyl-protein thioesterase 1-like n=1 Tax=Coffea eugenioides TaxID=49369 RepID=UPI000F608E26|nr:palmitoyl-protein thioesterase 1-like [Coffea eugenioides]